MAVNTVHDFLMESHSFYLQHHSHLILLTFVAFFLFLFCYSHYPWMISSLLHGFSFHTWMTSEYSQPSISIGSASGNLTSDGKYFGIQCQEGKLEFALSWQLFIGVPCFILHLFVCFTLLFFTNLGLWQPWIEQVCWCHF